eukprot:4351419-Amphidinium_carterae.1
MIHRRQTRCAMRDCALNDWQERRREHMRDVKPLIDTRLALLLSCLYCGYLLLRSACVNTAVGRPEACSTDVRPSVWASGLRMARKMSSSVRGMKPLRKKTAGLGSASENHPTKGVKTDE